MYAEQVIGSRLDASFELRDGVAAIAPGLDGTAPRLGLIVHHTDAECEFAQDRESHIGQLNTALDAAPGRGWVVVDMKQDWNRIYPAEE